MRRRVAFSRDTLQAALLPVVEYTELNYRPALPSPLVTIVAGAVLAGVVLFLVASLFWLLQFVGFLAGFLANLTMLLYLAIGVLFHFKSYSDQPGWNWRIALRRGMLSETSRKALSRRPGHGMFDGTARGRLACRVTCHENRL